MSRVVSRHTVAHAKRLLVAHGRKPDGSCRCGELYGQRCRRSREYAFYTLKLAGFNMGGVTW